MKIKSGCLRTTGPASSLPHESWLIFLTPPKGPLPPVPLASERQSTAPPAPVGRTKPYFTSVRVEGLSVFLQSLLRSLTQSHPCPARGKFSSAGEQGAQSQRKFPGIPSIQSHGLRHKSRTSDPGPGWGSNPRGETGREPEPCGAPVRDAQSRETQATDQSRVQSLAIWTGNKPQTLKRSSENMWLKS